MPSQIHCICIPLYSLPEVLPKYEEAIQTCIDKGGLGLHTTKEVLENLLSGNWMLWSMARGTEVVGFYITNILPHRYVEILYGYIKPSLDGTEDVKDRAIQEFENIARAFECSKIVAYSTRLGMGQVLTKDKGYDKHMAIYCKELN